MRTGTAFVDGLPSTSMMPRGGLADRHRDAWDRFLPAWPADAGRPTNPGRWYAPAVAELLLNFEGQGVNFHLRRRRLGHLVARELHVHHGADALNDLAHLVC